MKQLRLIDNTLYTEKGNSEYPRSKALEVLKYKKETKDIQFLKRLSSCTLEELNSKEDGGILVWPHSFEEHDKDLKDMKVVECVEKDKVIASLHTGNLVGWIGDGKVQVEINSRFSHNTDNNGEQDYFLYYMLSKVFRMNIVNMEVGSGSLKELDLLVFMFPRLLQEAMRQGLFKQYVKREYNDSNVKGAIDVNRHLRFNYPANGRIAYRTREFSFDNYITQLIRHTIVHIEKQPMGRALLSGSKEIEECVKHIVQSTPTFQKGQLRQVMADNRKVVSHPYFTKYKALQQICLAILRNERVSHGAQSDKVHGVLIDAAWLWEEYLAIVLAEKTGFMHHTSDNAFQLFDKGEGTFQTVIPDYLDAKNNLVADAKYIPLHRFDRLDAERAAAVYYKTIMYMYRFKATKGFLFHPCNNADIEYIKKQQAGSPSRLSHLNIDEENTQIFADYQIIDTAGCLHELGMIIPDADDYGEFCENMKKVEHTYNKKIKELTELKFV